MGIAIEVDGLVPHRGKLAVDGVARPTLRIRCLDG
jgi:hypothetical protein